MRQNERPDQHEHQDGNNQSPRARLDFASDTAFRRIDIVAEGVELALLTLVFAHRAPPDGSAVAAGCPTPGMPRLNGPGLPLAAARLEVPPPPGLCPAPLFARRGARPPRAPAAPP